MTLFSLTSSTYDAAHTPTHFERSLQSLGQEVLRMGALVEQSFRLSHQALFEQNLDALKAINQLEPQIDQYYRQIELDCARFMTLQRPVAQDLRLLSAFMHLVRDLERIGDYAQDLAEFAIKLFPYSRHDCLPEIAEMSQQAQLMLAASLEALAELDATAGKNVKRMDDVVDDAYDKLYDQLAHAKDVQGVVEPILLLGLVIRHLERMADHATNIGQRVSYIVTGQRG
ncbi:phosphate signaling complex protein PhoU [Spirulina subsalsa FACHB-351]|uniref:Phosphate-specific transport system accessory protein PhoU n=1 Tax=Spirulina subsalsa FACHB-351 TaxID=234711 RepID=A0ABT3L0Z0_9CYAN|nr:phosphate signaling complex protein PhoU [Spirulina subsalsa]MCW6035171.1 phosphate signaling complex protein PhoU [Spirulina subsalsa FACHB-351]